VTPDEISELRRTIRLSLDRYRGGRFSIEGAGGNQGMLMFNAAGGQQWFCGGLNAENARPICDALNAMLAVMEAGAPRSRRTSLKR